MNIGLKKKTLNKVLLILLLGNTTAKSGSEVDLYLQPDEASYHSVYAKVRKMLFSYEVGKTIPTVICKLHCLNVSVRNYSIVM